MRSWWTDRPRRGTRRRAVRATRTSGGRGVVNCWARRFVRFYARGRPRRKFRPRPTGCSAWPHDIYIHPESTVGEGSGYLRRPASEPAMVSAVIIDADPGLAQGVGAGREDGRGPMAND